VLGESHSSCAFFCAHHARECSNRACLLAQRWGSPCALLSTPWTHMSSQPHQHALRPLPASTCLHTVLDVRARQVHSSIAEVHRSIHCAHGKCPPYACTNTMSLQPIRRPQASAVHSTNAQQAQQYFLNNIYPGLVTQTCRSVCVCACVCVCARVCESACIQICGRSVAGGGGSHPPGSTAAPWPCCGARQPLSRTCVRAAWISAWSRA